MSNAWRFYVDHYFPYMYGLMMIENWSTENQQTTKLPNLKKDFTKKMISYLEENEIFYIESELEEILHFNINKEFRSVLLKSFSDWETQMPDILKLVNEVTEGC